MQFLQYLDFVLFCIVLFMCEYTDKVQYKERKGLIDEV